ncbi:MAG: ATPase [Solibacterales bacterium]|nr:ATPase [Bryobacterales bacterium]|tara:strand:+ start:7679 stop:8638 length:960 start_codon:yes stop_codon:yes gene_type:complete
MIKPQLSPNPSSPQDRFYLGLDGGQSHTTILIGNEEGTVLGTGLSGPTNYGGSDNTLKKTETSIKDALSQALEGAQLERTTDFTAACCGISGDTEKVHEIISRCINAEHLKIVTDAQIALWGAGELSPGIVVIAGTGSIAWGENGAHQTARAGGWGYAFGDEGGAFDIARQAMRSALKTEEGWGPKTSLRKALLKDANSSTVNDLLHRLYAEQLPRDAIASFALLVDRLAKTGDTVAKRILASAGLSLAHLAQGVRQQLFTPDETVSIYYSGGVFSSTFVLDAFHAQVATICDKPNRILMPRRSPAHGALLQACRVTEL